VALVCLAVVIQIARNCFVSWALVDWLWLRRTPAPAPASA
jgi:hypothetical protein